MNQKTVFSGFMWRFFERCGAQGVTLIVSLVLMRLLDPEVYGTISLILVFMTIMEVFVDSGMGNALIQKKDADNTDFTSVFIFNVSFSIVLYVAMFFGAKLIASLYSNSDMVAYVRVLSITLLIASVKNIQIAYVSRNMLFRKFFLATIIGTVTSGIVGIIMAYLGFGVWSLIAQNLTNTFMDTVILWFTVKWRPSGKFSMERFKRLYSFAWKLLVTSLIDTLYQKLRQLIIGKYYSEADLAFYNQGQHLPYTIISNINAAIDSVLLPTISSVQDDITKVKELTRRSISVGIYIIAPMLLGMFAVAEVLVRLVMTEKWLPCVFYLRVSCISFLFTPINTANLNAIKSLGRSDLVLRLEIIKKVTGVIILISTVFFGVKVIALGLLAASMIFQLINSWPNKKLLAYGYFSQISDIAPSILLSFAMAGAVFSISFLGLPDILTLAIQVPLGIILYVGGSYILKLEPFQFCLSFLKNLRRSHGS